MLRIVAVMCQLLLLASLNVSYAKKPNLYFATRVDVQSFINEMVQKHHFKKSELIKVFNQVKLRPQVIKHINKPLESEPWLKYQRLFVSKSHIADGVAFWKKWRTTLKRAEKQYGVPASIIVATIGIETRYGTRTGDYRVLDSLSNIAFNHSKRSKFFRYELEQFLLLTREQKFDPLSMKGSYAGAMGQGQFMPSSYRRYAVKYSKGSKIDLMHNVPDVIGSIANYYKKHGWKNHVPVATRITRLSKRYKKLVDDKKGNDPIRVSKLNKLGIILKHKFKSKTLTGRIVALPSNGSQEYWFGFENFYVIKRYNPSNLYAMAVYLLSYKITQQREHPNRA